jgi:uncharacterized protein
MASLSARDCMLAASVALLAGCTHVIAAQPVSQPPVQRSHIAPLVDGHQHMMGPGALSLLARQPAPPAVELPATLATMLRRREKGIDKSSYGTLYAPDALVFAEEHGQWWTGEDRILDALENFGTGYRFVATAYAIDRSAAYVAGILKDSSGRDSHDFMIGLRKSADGQWRIGTEMKQAISPPTYGTVPIGADKIIEVLDDAGIRYATVLSVGYWFGDPDKKIADRWAGTRAENDWVIAETRKYPARLIPFCGVNPIDDYAIAELERCAAMGVRGMKIHRNSKFRTANPEHLEKLKRFFRALNKHRMAVVIHLRDMPDVFIDQVLPEGPDVPVQIAHMGSALSSLRLFADAITAGKPGTKNLWFDWTQALPIEDLWMHGRPGGRIGGPVKPGEREQMAALMRQVGLGRILYGSDMPLSWNPSPREWWQKSVLKLPLTDDEIRDIADNVPPYIRPQSNTGL